MRTHWQKLMEATKFQRFLDRAILVDAVEYITELEAENRRLVQKEAHLLDALNFAHSEGFGWPADPLNTGPYAKDAAVAEQ